jgi:hypothetical protein
MGAMTPDLDVDSNTRAWRQHSLRWEVRLYLPKEVLYTSVLFCFTVTSVQDSSENYLSADLVQHGALFKNLFPI